MTGLVRILSFLVLGVITPGVFAQAINTNTLPSDTPFSQLEGNEQYVWRHNHTGNKGLAPTQLCQAYYGPGTTSTIVHGCDFTANACWPEPGGSTSGACCKTNDMVNCGSSGLGTTQRTVQVVTNPCYATGQYYVPNWDDQTEYSCSDTPPPPTDEECEAENGPGYVYQTITIGGTESGSCVLPLPDSTDQEDCSNALGTVEYNGQSHVICGDDVDECTASGGSWGTWGSGGVVQTGCLSGDYADDLPTCSSSGVFVADADTGSFVCESPEGLPDVPNQEPGTQPDDDDDGTPNRNDSDIDGDGLVNSQDSDQDGDGIPDVDDPTPQGEQESENEVSGGGGCDVAPNCQGDAIQCAILYQTWKTRCLAQEETGSDESDEIDQEVANQDVGDLYVEEDITTYFTDVFNPTQETANCPAPDQLTVAGATIEISYQLFCDLAGYVRPIVLLLFSLISARIIFRAF